MKVRRPVTLLEIDCITEVFLWILRKSKKHYFEEQLRTAASDSIKDGYFCGNTLGFYQKSPSQIFDRVLNKLYLLSRCEIREP